MRLLTRMLAVTATTATTVALLAAPASATPDPCPNSEPLCLYVNGFSVPIGVPTVYPTGVRPDPIPGPIVCDSTGTDCEQSYVVLAGAVVSASGYSLGTVNVPGFGIGVDGTTTRLYFSAPTLTGGGGTLGLTATLYIPVSPFYAEGTTPECATYHDIVVGTITTDPMCTLVVTIAV